ncbi:MAG: O-methyltransferase, partial [Anaerovoracaceae bacterium]
MRNIINEKVRAYTDGFYRPLTPALGELRITAEEKHVPIILKDTEALMLSLLNMQKPKRILEIGTAVGYSAGVMAAALPTAQIITLEKDGRAFALAKENLKNLGVEDRVRVLEGDGALLLSRLAEEETEKVQFIFIDAAKSHYRAFWDGAMKLAEPGTIILCDNILMNAAVADECYDETGRFKTSINKMREFLDYIA